MNHVFGRPFYGWKIMGIPDLLSYRELKRCGKDEKASSILRMKVQATKISFCYGYSDRQSVISASGPDFALPR